MWQGGGWVARSKRPPEMHKVCEGRKILKNGMMSYLYLSFHPYWYQILIYSDSIFARGHEGGGGGEGRRDRVSIITFSNASF